MKYLIRLDHQYKAGDLMKSIEDESVYVITEVHESFSSARSGSLKSIEDYRDLLEDILIDLNNLDYPNPSYDWIHNTCLNNKYNLKALNKDISFYISEALLNSHFKQVYNESEELPEGEPLIFMANHSSLIDLPLLKAVVPKCYVGLLAENHTNYFMYGSMVKRMGNIPIKRENIRASLKSFNLAKQALQQGFPIVVLPEGGRSQDGQLVPFKRLVFRFAKDSGAHIVPISFSGVFNMKNKGSLHLNPGPITVRFGTVIRSETIAEMELDEVLSATYNAIYDGLEPFEAGKLSAQ